MKAVLARLNTVGLLNGVKGDEKFSLTRLFKGKPLIAWLVVVTIFSVGYVHLIEPAFDLWANADKEAQKVYESINRKKALLDRAQIKLGSLVKARKEYLSLVAPAQNGSGEKGILDTLRKVAGTAGLGQVKVAALNSQTNASLIRKRFQLLALGSQAQVLAFVQGLLNKPEKIFIKEIDLEVDNANRSGILKAKLIMEIFQRKQRHQ